MKYFGLHHVQLTCPPGSEDTLRKFYVDVIGLTEVTKPVSLQPRGGCWFRLNEDPGVELHLGVQQDFQPSVKGHPGIVWGDLASLRELASRLEAAGHSVTWDGELHDTPMRLNGAPGSPTSEAGMFRFYVNDPHGNRIEFLAPRAKNQK
ncbi:catechol 2,3-dioxygenase-like lactoylglutathione lyase family enzyme [Stackebrandtia endophytica]|uniref:Catechol 2,3-dioxygenase-like lactoylglutathione lyase family enzyme n=1 Tax=Stackebrandtia endophytica TaxID=1496996 RepID=A0A543AQY1_9ACTN|nr:glyoxalase [Stackebrandtia endophytica]TQL74945.1 catechol 2,3-dioxygenase-like lactoylglutathione lyase family enzyme [Stackebrandtia endophytica]